MSARSLTRGVAALQGPASSRVGAHARRATAHHERQTSKGFARDASRDTRHATDRVGLYIMRRGWRLAVGSARRARCSACVRRAACAARVAAACALSDHGPCHRGRTGQRASFTCDDARIRTRGPVSRVCGGASESRQTHRATWTRGRVALSVEQTHMASSMRRRGLRRALHTNDVSRRRLLLPDCDAQSNSWNSTVLQRSQHAARPTR